MRSKLQLKTSFEALFDAESQLGLVDQRGAATGRPRFHDLRNYHAVAASERVDGSTSKATVLQTPRQTSHFLKNCCARI